MLVRTLKSYDKGVTFQENVLVLSIVMIIKESRCFLQSLLLFIAQQIVLSRNLSVNQIVFVLMSKDACAKGILFN